MENPNSRAIPNTNMFSLSTVNQDNLNIDILASGTIANKVEYEPMIINTIINGTLV